MADGKNLNRLPPASADAYLSKDNWGNCEEKKIFHSSPSIFKDRRKLR